MCQRLQFFASIGGSQKSERKVKSASLDLFRFGIGDVDKSFDLTWSVLVELRGRLGVYSE